MEGKGKGHYHMPVVQQEKSSDLIGLCACNNMQHHLLSKRLFSSEITCEDWHRKKGGKTCIILK